MDSTLKRDFKDLLECPVCFQTLSAPIFQCRSGHVVCKDCHPKLENCPICRELYDGPIRNVKLEEMVERYVWYCIIVILAYWIQQQIMKLQILNFYKIRLFFDNKNPIKIRLEKQTLNLDLLRDFLWNFRTNFLRHSIFKLVTIFFYRLQLSISKVDKKLALESIQIDAIVPKTPEETRKASIQLNIIEDDENVGYH